MTDEARAMQSADDAELLNRVRAGDTEAFQVLYQRHEQAVRLLARDLVATVAELDDLVAETFAQLLAVTRRGGGPADAFRPYALTALRRVCNDRLTQSQMTAGDGHPGDNLANPGEPAIDPAVASLDDSLIVRAFLSLPERWIAVLWHIEIEGASPAEVAPLLGLSRNGVAGLRRQAKDGLRRAYSQMYTSGMARPECTTVAVRIGAFIRDAVPGPDSAMVTEHLSQCDDCRAVFAELSDVSIPLRAMVAPVVLGGSADYYLSGVTPDGQARPVPAVAAGAMAAAAAGPTTAGTASWPQPLALARGTARPRRWLAAAGAAVVAAGAIAFGISLAGHGTPLKPTASEQAQAPASLQAPTVAQASATPARSTTAPAVVRASVGRSTAAGPSASPQSSTSPARPPSSTSPARPPGKSPPPSASPSQSAPVQLAAVVDVYSGHHDSKVVFQVSDTGSARTGALIVSVALPTGSSLLPGGHGGGNGGGGDQGNGGHGGWSCKATSSGASCQHDPIPAGGQSQGVIFIAINGSSACGQTVSVSAASGSASASAQSPEEIQC